MTSVRQGGCNCTDRWKSPITRGYKSMGRRGGRKKKTGEIYGVLDAEEIRSHGFDAGRLHEKGLQANPFHDPSCEQNSRGKGSSWESANAWGRAQGELKRGLALTPGSISSVPLLDQASFHCPIRGGLTLASLPRNCKHTGASYRAPIEWDSPPGFM